MVHAHHLFNIIFRLFLLLAAEVIASVAPGQLYDTLLGQPETARGYRHGRGNYQLHYALDGAPQWNADGLDDVALIHLADGVDSVSKSANEAERGMLPEVPTICVGQPHRLDPTRCPEGKAILWLQIPDAPRVVKGDAAGERIVSSDARKSQTFGRFLITLPVP